MVENKYKIKVNTKANMFSQIPEVVANDNVVFEIEIFDDSTLFPTSSGYTYRLVSLKKSGKSVIRNGTFSNGVIRFVLGSSEMTEPGRVEGTVQIYDSSNKRISTAHFDYLVKRDPSLQGGLPTDDKTLVIANESVMLDAIDKSKLAMDRVDTLIRETPQPSEVVDMRVRNDGSTAPTAGSHLREIASQMAHKAEKEEVVDLRNTKLDKNGLLSMANMGQDVKEAMTGGSVAVVGRNAILEENIVDRQVTTKKTDFIKEGKNLFNKKTVTLGKSLASTTGALIDNANFSVTDFIEVTEQTYYECLNANLVTHVYYDVDNNIISGVGSSVSSFTTPPNCKYVRGTVGSAFVDVFHLGKGTVTKYEPYGIELSEALLKRDDVARSAIDSLYNNYLKDNVEWEEYAKRLTFTSGKTAGAKNGVVEYADNEIYSIFEVAVNTGEIWRLSGYGNPSPATSGVLLDDANNLVSMLRYNAQTEQLLVIPEGVTKMAVTVLTASLNSLSIARAKRKSNDNHDFSNLVNMHYADLTNEFTFTSGKFVRKLVGNPIEFVDSVAFSYTKVPVKEGEVWRTIDYSITAASNWNVRGIFVDSNGNYLSDIPFDKIDSFTNTFIVPYKTAEMIINKRSATRLYKLVDWESVFNHSTDTHVTGHFVSNAGVVTASSYYGYIEKDVTPGEIYRITDIFHGTGETITARGVFKDSTGNVVKTIKSTLNDPFQWNDVVAPAGASKIFVNFLLSVNGVPNAVKRLTLSKAIPPILNFGDNSSLRDKTNVQFGDSLTWYGERGILVKHATGLKVVVQGYSGHTIAQTSNNVNLCDDEKLQRIIDENPNIVTIMGGNNDKGYNVPLGDISDLYADLGTEDKGTYIGAFAYIIKKLLSLKSDTQIIIMTPLSARGDSPNTLGLLTTDYADASRKIAEFFSYAGVDIRGKIGLNKYTLDLYTRDEVHLNFRGSQPIAKEEIKALREINWAVA